MSTPRAPERRIRERRTRSNPDADPHPDPGQDPAPEGKRRDRLRPNVVPSRGHPYR